MNERIKQMAEQADNFADDKIQMPGEYHPDWHDVRDEKFAELIVKECVKSLWTEECYNSDLALEEFNRNAAKIKQHLGVEE